MTEPAGRLSEELLELMFRHLPIGVSVADENDVVCFWTAVSAGGSHTLALKKDGTPWAWGDNEFGELGFGDTTDRWTPTEVTGAMP